MPDDAEGSLSLFREEAVREAANRHGHPIKPLGIASWLSVGFLLATLAAAIIFLSTIQFAQKETVEGVLVPASGAMKVVSLRGGTVSALWVREGDNVRAGQPLMTISVDSTVDGGQSLGTLLTQAATEEVSTLNRELAAHRQLVLRQEQDIDVRRVGLQQQKTALASEASIQQQRRDISAAGAAAAQTLYDRRLMSSVDYRQREDSLLSATQSQASLQHDEAGVTESLADLDVEAERVRAQGADDEAQIEYVRAQILEKRAQALAQRDVVVTAERSGRIGTMSAKIGASVVQGEALAVLLPGSGDLEAELWIPSRSAGFLRKGDSVGLMYDAFPYQRFGTAKGRVVKIADAPVQPQDLPIQPTVDTKQSLYKVQVALDQQTMNAYSRPWPLIAGMHLTADVVLQRQTLMEWLLEPVLAARAREQER